MQRIPGVALTVPDLLSLPPDAARQRVAEWLAQRGEPAYRSTQIVPRLWQRPVRTWDQATDLPAPLRSALAAAFPLRRLALGTRQLSSDGTEKYLWDLGDGEAIESVLIPEGKRRTLCISSQVGCALGCVFCATGRMGFRRNLTATEIAAQVREVILLDPALAPTNVVFMGMGEPLLNWDAVDTALTILNHPHGLGIGARHITVSTVGILPGRAQLARPLGALVNLLPLHPGGAPDLTPSTRAQMLGFERRLKRHGVDAVLRRSRGLDISAACGQLRVELEARRKVGAEEHARVE